MPKNSFFVVSLLALTFSGAAAQAVTIFSLADFELKHEVKSCLVSTSYGQEEYEFNQQGLLTKAVTRYNEKDYDVVHYKYDGRELLEKRSETYRDNTFDARTSIAHFFTLDTTANRMVKEKVVSYEKELLERYTYQYDEQGRLTAITRSNPEGTDKTVLEYTSEKGEETVTWTINGEPLKSVRTSEQKKLDGTVQKVVLTKEFLRGEGSKALEEVFAPDGKLLARQDFLYNPKKKSFVPTVHTTFEYNGEGLLTSEIAKEGSQSKKTDYLYQYDRAAGGNWVKKIVTPDNTYTTRKITYYPQSEADVEKQK